MDKANFRGASLRKGRHSQAGQIYLITFCTLNRCCLFLEWSTGRPVVAAMREAFNQSLADTLCYVVMPDHVHWLLRLRSDDLSDLIKTVKSNAAIAFNRATGHVGPVWQAGFHDHAVRAEEDVRALARYVVANPLRKGLVSDISQYPLWDAVWLDEKHRGQGRSYSPLDL